ncbi:nucleoside diphosphate-linked moiety X motif 19, mitochondrial [Rhypophila decipiens]|uniref:Nucleoside diphosphate-linked moiety X motif 19, mitochondrial n=1 Tax=Rhypophila decipiens TaxID=261697 RepID=A0AAN6Y750_9PEZI|nr:nucleoside diphosphate-linked moiety X motif 19, mitochondrial [Rhypophila decipiens]
MARARLCLHCVRNSALSRAVTKPLKDIRVKVDIIRRQHHSRVATELPQPYSLPPYTAKRYFSKMTPRQSAPTSTSSPSSRAGASDKPQTKTKRPPPTPVRPSSSILLISPNNQVLLLHRVQTSKSFASAHVFPGGNLSSFHEGPLPEPGSESLHEDSLVYRLAAVRETFEESGILLAKTKDGSLLGLSDQVREAGRKAVHGNTIKFIDWLVSVGGIPDTDGLTPFTRWITPPNGPNRRFSTQMYIYMLPLSAASASLGPTAGAEGHEVIIPTPTHDGGLEHTAAAFDDPSNWISRARSGEIILFPPQFFLLHIVSQFIKGGDTSSARNYQTEREGLMEFLSRTPTVRSDRPGGKEARIHATASIPWADKVISPTVLFMRQSDRRVVLGLDKPGPELKGTKRGGDWDRVVLVSFRKEGPRDVEVRWREDVLREEREAERKEAERGAKL